MEKQFNFRSDISIAFLPFNPHSFSDPIVHFFPTFMPCNGTKNNRGWKEFLAAGGEFYC